MAPICRSGAASGRSSLTAEVSRCHFAPRPSPSLASRGRAPERDQAAWLQVVPRPGRDPARAGRGRGRRARTAPGKSNVADAIVWAAGSLAPSELRAEKPDDVLFAGGGDAQGRPTTARSSCCSTTRTAPGPIDFSELSIVAPAAPRRRGPVPGQPRSGAAPRHRGAARRPRPRPAGCTRSSARASVEEILASTPEKRRELDRGGRRAGALQAPPAPGRAEARAGRGAGRARTRRRGGGSEAAPAARAPGDGGRAGGAARAGARVARGPHRRSSTWPSCEERLASTDERRLAGSSRARSVDERLEAAARRPRRRRGGARRRRGPARGRPLPALYRLTAARASGSRCGASRRRGCGLALPDARRSRCSTAGSAPATLAERARLCAERLRALERSLAEREGVPPAARALAEEGERLALSTSSTSSRATSRAVAAALG